VIIYAKRKEKKEIKNSKTQTEKAAQKEQA